jgi:hypothetical protein
VDALPLYTACIYLGAITPDHHGISLAGFDGNYSDLIGYQNFAVGRGILRRKLLGG